MSDVVNAELLREKIARAAYNGGIYGVCSWKELAHDHQDRADFLKRADAEMDAALQPFTVTK